MPQGPFFQTPTPLLDKNPGPMDARFLSSVGLGFGTRIGRTQLFPTPVLDKNQLPIDYPFRVHCNNWDLDLSDEGF